MSKVTNATSMFTKLCWVSTFETPREPHFALVSTVFGGIRPKIQPEAKDSSMVVVDGARPVSMVAWKQAAVETSRAAQAMAAMVRMEPSLGRGERRQYARVSETLQMPPPRPALQAGSAAAVVFRKAGSAWENWIQTTAPRINAIAAKVRGVTASSRSSQPSKTAMTGFTYA